MGTFLKIIAGLIGVLGLMVVFAINQPMTASNILWPALESVMLDEPYVGITANGVVEPAIGDPVIYYSTVVGPLWELLNTPASS